MSYSTPTRSPNVSGSKISTGKTLQSPPPKRADVSGARPRNAAFDTNVSSPRSAARMASRSRWWCSALSKISSEVSGPLWPALTRRECALNACWPSLFSFPFLVSFLSANTVFTEPKLDEEDAPPAADANTSASMFPSAVASDGNKVAIITSPAVSMALGIASQIAMALFFSLAASFSTTLTHASPSFTKPGKHSVHVLPGTKKPWRWHLISSFFKLWLSSMVLTLSLKHPILLLPWHVPYVGVDVHLFPTHLIFTQCFFEPVWHG
mmetsp:Transcript_2824/g.10792  ORF Transcript_2824/g.10792 Transcript_2824/m.10792 type:complete len:266 (-) Transcript_2824:699-1496(-)